jgi:putative membrane protein
MTKDKTQTEMAEERTDWAHLRTVMASDRTLMAWTRTSLSLISFGFTVFKFMEAMQGEGKTFIKFRGEQGAQNFGMTLITIGIISLAIACYQYWQFEKRYNPDRKWYLNVNFMTAAFIAFLGLLSLLNTVFKIGPF